MNLQYTKHDLKSSNCKRVLGTTFKQSRLTCCYLQIYAVGSVAGAAYVEPVV